MKRPQKQIANIPSIAGVEIEKITFIDGLKKGLVLVVEKEPLFHRKACKFELPNGMFLAYEFTREEPERTKEGFIKCKYACLLNSDNVIISSKEAKKILSSLKFNS
jgi:hypothetical protein